MRDIICNNKEKRMKRFFEHYANKMIQRGIIGEAERETYIYGLEVIVITILPLITIYFIALLINCLSEITMVLLGFVPMRIYLGGYHCSTRIKCYISTLTFFGVLLLLLFKIPAEWYFFIIVSGAIVSFLIVRKLQPIVHINKKLKVERITSCGRSVKRICFIECLISVVGTVIYRDNLSLMAFSLGIWGCVGLFILEHYLKRWNHKDVAINK